MEAGNQKPEARSQQQGGYPPDDSRNTRQERRAIHVGDGCHFRHAGGDRRANFTDEFHRAGGDRRFLHERRATNDERRLAADFPFDISQLDFTEGKRFAAILRCAYHDAKELLLEGFHDATEGWRLKLRSMMAARNMTAIEAHFKLVETLKDKGMLQRSVLLMIRATLYDVLTRDAARTKTE